MKIHRLGNDYAFQKWQKSERTESMNDEPETQPIIESEIKTEFNVANQIQDGGEGTVEDDSKENIPASQTGMQKTPKKEKKAFAEEDKLPETC